MQHTTVTVQGFAWCPKTRTHSDKVIYEARNRVEAVNWMKYQRRWMKDLKIVRNNNRHILDSLLASCTDIPEVRAAADRRLEEMSRQNEVGELRS